MAQSLPLTGGKTPTEYILCLDLAEGYHVVKVLKQSEAEHSSATIKSVTALGNDNYGIVTAPTKPDKKIEFYGDSLTSGYNALGGNTSATEIGNTSAQYNAKCSALDNYAYYTAGALGASCSIVAGEGITLSSGTTAGVLGMCTPTSTDDWNNLAPQIGYNYCNYFQSVDFGWHWYLSGRKATNGSNQASTAYGEWFETSTTVNYSSYIPDVVVINLGSNDWLSGKITANNYSNFKDCYARMVNVLLEKYASNQNLKIVLCYDMAYCTTWSNNGGTNKDWKNQFKTAVEAVKTQINNAKVTTLDMSLNFGTSETGGWAVRDNKSLHPNRVEQMNIAESSLIPYLKQLLNIQEVDERYTLASLNNYLTK